MHVVAGTTALLIGSNVFMTLAWYGHLRWLDHRAWYLAVFVAWGIALFEYALQVPANRLGFTRMTLPQLKILQEGLVDDDGDRASRPVPIPRLFGPIVRAPR